MTHALKRFSLLIIAPVILISCVENQGGKGYAARGKELTQTSLKVLSGQLQGALQAGGVQNAIEYCNLNAYPIIDSLSLEHHATIRRATFQARNQENKPNEYEQEVLIVFTKAHKEGNQISPVLKRLGDGTMVYFSPVIIENGLCLTCHGNPGSSIKDEDYELIRSLYPEDEAIGYQMGDLRGMWSISFSE